MFAIAFVIVTWYMLMTLGYFMYLRRQTKIRKCASDRQCIEEGGMQKLRTGLLYSIGAQINYIFFNDGLPWF